jgi:folate-binding Fe-S cluster repair protein YgfZ
MGVDDAIDHEKGCYVGQEVVARVHQRAGGPDRRLVRLDAAGPLDAGVAVLDGDEAVGEVTTAAEAPALGPIALAVVDDDAPRRLRAADGTPVRRVDTAAGLAGDGTAPPEGKVSP